MLGAVLGVVAVIEGHVSARVLMKHSTDNTADIATTACHVNSRGQSMAAILICVLHLLPKPQALHGQSPKLTLLILHSQRKMLLLAGLDNLLLFVGCLTSQKHTCVSQGRICSDNFA